MSKHDDLVRDIGEKEVRDLRKKTLDEMFLKYFLTFFNGSFIYEKSTIRSALSSVFMPWFYKGRQKTSMRFRDENNILCLHEQ